MTRIFLDPPLSAKCGDELVVVDVERISTEHQDERSLDDQRALLRRWVSDRYDGPIRWISISSRGSGEYLDRAELNQLEQLIESGEIDLVIAEDLGRICRRNRAMDICELCQDQETRLLALNDQVDTERPDWHLTAFFSVFRHESYNRDTSARIRRSLRNRFQSGGVVQTTIFGYRKIDGSSLDSDLEKDAAAEQIYDEWFAKLENGVSFAEIADWLNDHGIRPGSFCRSDKWDGPMVGRVTRNPILKGLRVRNEKMSKRIHKTGRRKSIKAPDEERLERYCAHLAFIEPERFDRVLSAVNERNSAYRRRGVNGRDTRANVPKKRTRWPGQHLYCGVCGRMFVWGGHGQTQHLMCNGVRAYNCWQAISVDGPLAAHKISDAIYHAISELPGFDPSIIANLHDEVAKLNLSGSDELRSLETKLSQVNCEIENLLQFIRQGVNSRAVSEDLHRLERERSSLTHQRDQLAKRPTCVPALPSMDQIKQMAREAMQSQADDPYEFGRVMKQLIPRIEVYPFRLCDGGHIVLCAQFSLRLTSLVPDAAEFGGVADSLTRSIHVDLFNPPQREAFRQRLVELRAAGWRVKRIARELGITVSAAQHAAALQRRMNELGINDPYLSINSPPDDYKKLQRHNNRRYQFEPLENYPGSWTG